MTAIEGPGTVDRPVICAVLLLAAVAPAPLDDLPLTHGGGHLSRPSYSIPLATLPGPQSGATGVAHCAEAIQCRSLDRKLLGGKTNGRAISGPPGSNAAPPREKPDLIV